MLSIPQRYYVPERIRESFRPRLEAAGLWRTPPAEETEKKKPLMETFRRVQDENDQFSLVFNRQKVRQTGYPHINIEFGLRLSKNVGHTLTCMLDYLTEAVSATYGALTSLSPQTDSPT
jgi:sorting and assembly machinery component 37